MRFALLAAASSLLVGFATFACSSAPPSAAEDADAGNPKTATNDVVASKDDTPATVVSDAGTTSDAAPADEGALTVEGDAGPACLADSLRESESNNDVATADKLPASTSSFCGRITSGDVDVVTFVMPAQLDNFFFQVEEIRGGRLTIQPSVDGEDFSFNGRYPFVPGGTYALKLSGNVAAGREITYRIKLTFN